MKKKSITVIMTIVLILSLFSNISLLRNEAKAATENIQPRKVSKPILSPSPSGRSVYSQGKISTPSSSGNSTNKQTTKQNITSLENINNKQNSEKQNVVDFGPYMRDMQRRIKLNWDPPKQETSNSVTLLYSLNKKGEIIKCSVLKSSGSQKVDKAAKDALFNTAPFRPLPADFKGEKIDVQFTFDYNVFGSSIQEK